MPSVPKGFTQHHNGHGSTTAIIIRKSLSHFPLSEFSTENMTSIVIHTKNVGKVVISSLYCPQRNPPLCEDWLKIQDKIKNIRAESITGVDSNCHSTLVGYTKSDKRAEEWETFLITNNLVIHNDVGIKTFQNSRGYQSTIDWTVLSTTIVSRIQNWQVAEDHESLSDHKAIFFNLNEDPIYADSKKWNFSKTDWEKFRTQMQVNLENYGNGRTPIEEVKGISDALRATIEATVPRTRKQNYKNKWWNTSLQESKTALKRTKRKGINEEYHRMKAKFEADIATAKQESWEKFTSTLKGRNDAYIRYKILCKTKDNNTLPTLKINNNWTNSTKDSANELLKSNLPDLPRPLSQNQTNIENEVETFLSASKATQGLEPQITLTEVCKVIREQNPGRAPGIDEIPGIVFKQTIDIIGPKLTKTFNSLFQADLFPPNWGTAKIIFIKKPNKRSSDPAAYRPISFLPTLRKIYEKVILHRLNWHTRKNTVIDNGQFGFQKGVSAEQAGLNLANSISQAFKTRREVGAVFCDISKAFPTIWHAGLLKKIIDNSIPVEYIRFMNSYLANQSVVVEKVEKVVEKSWLCGARRKPKHTLVFFTFSGSFLFHRFCFQ